MFGRQHEVVMVGCGPLARETAKDLAARLRVVGAFSLEGEPARTDLGVPILGRASELARFLESSPVDEVYLASAVRQHHAELQSVVSVCERLGVPFAVPAHVFRLGRAMPTRQRLVADGYLHYEMTNGGPVKNALKRAADVLLSAGALIALLPLFASVAAAVKLTSSGPVFYKQIRVGLRGRLFHMYKFRSMVVDADRQLASLMANNEQSGPVFKMRRDPRVTAVGRVIRKYSIDELPQLLNVLKGDMSIVGPRPPVPSEVAKYEPWQRRRLSVRPGLTCFWQVQGRNEIGFDEWMLLDLQYVDQWSVAKDIGLIGRTVPVVVTGRGAS